MTNSDKDDGLPDTETEHQRGESYEMPPLLTALILKAGREGHTMQHLADVLNVSYARLNQWRRGEAHISNAHRSVHERAAEYLNIPVVLVLTLAQGIQLSDLFWPDEETLEKRVEAGIELLYADPFLGGFVPPTLRDAEAPVQMFILFLYRELNAAGASRFEAGAASWLRPVRSALGAAYPTCRDSP